MHFHVFFCILLFSRSTEDAFLAIFKLFNRNSSEHGKLPGLLIAKFHYTGMAGPDPTRPGSPTKSAGSVQSRHVRTLSVGLVGSVTPVVKVVMCSRGGAEPLRSRRTKISIQCCTQKLHFKLTAPVYPAPGVECFSKANTK